MRHLLQAFPLRLSALSAFALVATLSGCEPDLGSTPANLPASSPSAPTSHANPQMGTSEEIGRSFDTGDFLFDSWDMLKADFINTGESFVRVELRVLDQGLNEVLVRKIEFGPGETVRATLNVPRAVGCDRFDYKVRYTVYYPDEASALSPDSGFRFEFHSSDPDKSTFRGDCDGLNCFGFDFQTNAPPLNIGAFNCPQDAR